MKNIKFYCHKTWDEEFKQIALTPVLYYCSNTYAKLKIISVLFLFWDFGIIFYLNKNK